ncbi:Protein sel-1-like 1 [Stylophora pistillata]|uniref:Protein sel-1-like 1 n=2 Tax=Stylophora pistillata TaxID=50429 RepID=A0A2B4SRS5_STYPI|nr:Protein sel-1-like 1 [Stylophora pistillata]
MAALRCFRVPLACRPVVADGIHFSMRMQCVFFSHRYSLIFLATESGISPMLKNTFGDHETPLLGSQKKRFFTSSSVTPDGNPQITFESLSDLIKDKLQESFNQNSLATHLKVLEALIKHWKGEVLSVSVTRKAAELSSEDVYRLATLIFEAQESVGKDAVELAAPLFRFSAMAGNPDGMYSYAKLLETGEGGVERDPIEAGKLFSELADQGHPFAQFALAHFYHNGIGMKKDLQMALELYEASAKKGVREANTMIGNLYTTGEIGKVDLTKAAKFFTNAAEKGDVPALMSLGAFYSQGTGVEKNFQKSFKCYKAAADQGHLTAQYNVGVNYFAGKGVENNMKKAAYYFDLAAQQGHVFAQINLGNMYYFGYGVEKNWEKSRQLYKEAAKNNQHAELLLQELQHEMENLGKNDDPY